VRGNKELITNHFVGECEDKVKELQPGCDSQKCCGRFDNMELVMTSPSPQTGTPWNDSTTKLMKMDIIAILEKEGFKIVTASIDQGREMLMMYKE
jgi:hypothetical protein